MKLLQKFFCSGLHFCTIEVFACFENAENILFDCQLPKNRGFLREVANAVVLRFIDLSGVGGEDSADTFHQSRLACAIMSGESHALLISDGEGEILENDTGSKFNAKVFDGEHGGGVVETDTIGKEFWRD